MVRCSGLAAALPRSPTWITVGLCVLLAGCPPNGHVLYEGETSESSGQGFDIFDVEIKDGDPAGSPTDLTNSTGDDVSPAWNQETGRIAFASDRGENFDIYVMGADGQNVSQLTTDAKIDWFPGWEPSGDRITFASDRDGDFEIMVMENDGANQIALTENACLDTEPAWSPDGAKIAFTSDCDGSDLEIFVINTDGSSRTRLTDRPLSDDVRPAWSADSQRIAFQTVPTGSSAETSSQILLINADGSNLQQVSTAVPVGSLIHPAWSPNGNFLAVSMLNASGDWNIHTINLNDGSVRTIVDEPDTQWSPAWGDPSR